VSARKANSARFTRHKTRHRGISYRLHSDGTRQYAVFFGGRYIAVEGGEHEAVAKQAELRGKAARGERVVTQTKATFGEVAVMWLESKRIRDYTRRNYRATLDKVLLPRFGERKVASITTDDVAALVRALERKGLAPATITGYMKPLSGTMKFAMRRGFVAVNPCSLLTKDERPQPREHREEHVWSDEEIEALVEAAERLAREPESRYDYSPLIRTALYTGLRQGELLGLQWQDIDLHDGVLYVRRQWTRTGTYGPTKTRSGVRRLPLSADMVKFLTALKLRTQHSKDDDPVFASNNGTPLGHRNVAGRGFEPAAKLAGIKGITFHDMRDAFASRMIARGIQLVPLAKLLGHEDARITLSRYAHLYDRQRTDEAVRRAMASTL
jgi:integrase